MDQAHQNMDQVHDPAPFMNSAHGPPFFTPAILLPLNTVVTKMTK